MSSSASKFREALKDDKFKRRFNGLFMRMIDGASSPTEMMKRLTVTWPDSGSVHAIYRRC
jgi:CRISPR-associated endonuclease Cas2